MKALIVDDSISVRKALERILNTRDIVTVTAGSAEEAITLLPHSDAEIVITDVVMPGMSGFELCKHIKAGELSHLPVVLISGVVDDEVNMQAARAGASMIVTKPFTPEELFPKLEAALAGDTLAKQLSEGEDLLIQEDDAIFETPSDELTDAPAAELPAPEMPMVDAPMQAEAQSGFSELEPADQASAEYSPIEHSPAAEQPAAEAPPAEAYKPSYEVLEPSADDALFETDTATDGEDTALFEAEVDDVETDDVLPAVADQADDLDAIAAEAEPAAEAAPDLFADADANEDVSDISAEADYVEPVAEAPADISMETSIETPAIETPAAELIPEESLPAISEPSAFEPESVSLSAESETDDELLLFLDEDYAAPEPALQEPTYVNVPTPQFDGPLSPEALGELSVFLRHPSVRSALVVNRAGACIAAEGEGDAEADSLASYVNTLVSIAGVLGGKLGAEDLDHFHLEYEGASLVLFRLDAEHRLLLTLADSSALGVLHYLVRRYIENAGEAALAK